MCFVLHIASRGPLALLPWDENARAFNVAPVAEWGRDALGQFKLPHVYELGSAKRCGCGFRNVSYQDGAWPGEGWRPDDMMDPDEQLNHEQMVAFLRSHLQKGAVFELYGGWNGELAGKCKSDLIDTRKIK